MSRTYEPLELDLDWAAEEVGTMPSVCSTPTPPASGIEWVKLGAEGESESWGLEWVDDIQEIPQAFAESEDETTAETPDAKKRDTLRASPPPPSFDVVPMVRVTLPSLTRGAARVALIQEAAAVVARSAQRRAS